MQFACLCGVWTEVLLASWIRDFLYLVVITWSIISISFKELEGLIRFESQRQCLNPVESIQFYFFEIHFQIGV